MSSRALRVAVIAACPFPLARGTPVRVLRLSEALADRGHDVHVFTYHLGSGPVGPGVSVHRIADVPSYRKLSPGPSLTKLVRLDPMLARLARRAHRTQRFDAIHAHHYEGLMVGAAMRAGRRVPLVYDAHTMLTSELPSYSLGLPMFAKRGLSHALDRMLPALADHTVTVSQKIRDTLVGEIGMPADRVTTMANGVEFEHFDPAPHAPPSASGPQRVIFTGNLAAYQGLDHLLRAFQRVLQKVPDARLAIGTDDRFDAYEALSAELGIRAAIDMQPDQPAIARQRKRIAKRYFTGRSIMKDKGVDHARSTKMVMPLGGVSGGVAQAMRIASARARSNIAGATRGSWSTVSARDRDRRSSDCHRSRRRADEREAGMGDRRRAVMEEWAGQNPSDHKETGAAMPGGCDGF